MQKQVDKSHYNFSSYLNKQRWSSLWHQLDEVINLNPGRVLEIGPGPGVFKAVAGSFGVTVETLDIDPDLNPDHIASVFELPFDNEVFDVVCAFQMLEHLPFEKSVEAFKEIVRVSKKMIVISLPNAKALLPFSLYLPKIGRIELLLTRPQFKRQIHQFDGEHYWEISKVGYSVNRVIKELMKNNNVRLTKSYRVHGHSYHHFFIFKKQ